MFAALPLLAQTASGFLGAANTSAPTDLEAAINAKNNINWGSSFAVGSGASAASSPSLSAGSGLGGIPPDYILAGAILAAAVGLAVVLK